MASVVLSPHLPSLVDEDLGMVHFIPYSAKCQYCTKPRMDAIIHMETFDGDLKYVTDLLNITVIRTCYVIFLKNKILSLFLGLAGPWD